MQIPPPHQSNTSEEEFGAVPGKWGTRKSAERESEVPCGRREISETFAPMAVLGGLYATENRALPQEVTPGVFLQLLLPLYNSI